MKILISKLKFILIASTIFMLSCSDDDNNYSPSFPEVAIQNISNVTSTAQEDTVYLKASISSLSKSTFSWYVNDKEIDSATDSIFKFVSSSMGEYTIRLVSSNIDGESSSELKINVYGKYKYGTFVLNEGNMTSENGSLIFISPKGVITDSAYFKANGSEIGNVAQDLFIKDNKMYIISQNGGADGMLIVANAETLKKEAGYQTEIASTLSWPSHVAVLNPENIYIRDNKGVYLFNSIDKSLNLIEGTSGASKNRMAVVKDKAFVPCKKNVLVLEKGKNNVSHTIEFDGTVSGVIKANDGNIWVSTTGNPNKITKINPTDYSIIKVNEVTEGKLGAGWGVSPGISAKGDTIYYSNASTKIYRHIFNENKSELLVDAKELVENSNIVYNNLAVHPKTGEVYLNTIKGYGMNYLINNISVFDFSDKTPKLSNNYTDHTHFPAGVFFTYDFE